MTDAKELISTIINDNYDEPHWKVTRKIFQALAAANLEVVEGWRPIDVDKFVDGQSYIVTNKDYFPKAEVARFRKGNNADNEDLFICGIMTQFYSCDTFTHWRPLDTPPTD